VTFRSDSGRQLFDLQDAPLPDPDTPAPVRFLPEYDNLLLSHADRSRIIPDGRKVPLPPGNGALMGTVLIDGFYRGDWKLGVDGDIATLSLTPFARLPVAIRTMSRVKASLCWRFWRRGPNAVG